MSLYVLDTDTLTLYQHGHANVIRQVSSHAASELAITVISVEEQLSGWYSQLRQAKQPHQLANVYQRLANAVQAPARLPILSFALPAITRYDSLKALKLNVGKMDLRIAAITLECGGILVTRNTRDFQLIPNLVLEDRSA
jgi:tRNA(fMet)-specific endonuclease VapC